MEITPEEILASQVGIGTAQEVSNISTEDIEAAEEAGSDSDAFSDNDAREEQIELITTQSTNWSSRARRPRTKGQIRTETIVASPTGHEHQKHRRCDGCNSGQITGQDLQ